MRYEDNQGGGDDTAANGLKAVFCSGDDWKIQEQRQFDGFWGDWKGVVMCPENYYVDGMSIRYLQPQSYNYDDTAMTGLKFRCRLPSKDPKFQEITIY